MSRYFAPISVRELRVKVLECDVDDYSNLTPAVTKDLRKVKFSTENMDNCGFDTLPNGMPYFLVSAGGDWECCVYFIIYFDGKKLRGYIPKEGNLYNTDTNEAFGNDEVRDLKNARKRWPNEAYLKEADADLHGWFDYGTEEIEKMKYDIMKRILPLPLTKEKVCSKFEGWWQSKFTDKEPWGEFTTKIKKLCRQAWEAGKNG